MIRNVNEVQVHVHVMVIYKFAFVLQIHMDSLNVWRDVENQIGIPFYRHVLR